MTQDDLLYRFRLRVFAIAAELGNARAACRAILMSVPVVVLFLVLQKYFVRALTEGAVKS